MFKNIDLKKKIVFFLGLFFLYSFFMKKKSFSSTDIIVEKAKFFEGIHEIGDNKAFTDKVFEEMMKKEGWKSGQQWCAYFVRAVFCSALPEFAKCFRLVLNGLSQQAFVNAKNNKCKYLKAISFGSLQVGDIVIFQNIDNSSKGHQGICISINGNSSKLVEGNTNVDKSYPGEEELVDVVNHLNIEIGSVSNLYKSKKIRGFIRFSE